MSNFLDEKRQEIAARLKELEPLVAEYKQLEAASNALAGVSPVTPRVAAPPAAPRARVARASKPAAAASARRGRPRGSGARAQEALNLVGSTPGITIPELAAAMGIKQNYLYRVMPSLEKDRRVVKRDRGWHLVK